MKIIYIAPSKLPSDKANSIHVLNQSIAFSNVGYKLKLITIRKFLFEKKFIRKIKDYYGLNSKNLNIKIKSKYFPFNYANSFIIFLYSIFFIIFSNKYSLIISRNLYSAYFGCILKKKNLIYETHQIEKGIQSYIQRKIFLSNIKTILISNKLKFHLENNYNLKIKNYEILHDAAPLGEPLNLDEKFNLLNKYIKDQHNWNVKIGYFGSLYEGRGIEFISELAKYNQDKLFMIFGSHKSSFFSKKNMKFYGRISHSNALKIMKCVDILIMPYQNKVSIGQNNHDTSMWMSPLKMFEYMSSKTPIISSDHEVLKEVLTNRQNAILCKYNDINDWNKAINKLSNDNILSSKLSNNAYNDFIQKYTWNIRAKRIIKFFKKNNDFSNTTSFN